MKKPFYLREGICGIN